jgi:hypothetical protein
VLNGWRTVPRKGERARVGALVTGAVAALAMGVVGCTSIIRGSATMDTSAAPAYRSSVSESAATSSIRETQRQQSLTTQAVRGACGRFASTSADAVDSVNRYVEAFNNGGDISGTAGPAVEALNHSADEVIGAMNEKMSSELRDAFSSYVDAARSVANAISTRASVSVYNTRKEQLNDIRDKGLQLCKTY